MTLEDHVGDIIRKARQAARISPEAAAASAGILPQAYSQLEDTGQCDPRPQFEALAPLLKLDARKLAGIADGWLPATVDLSLWRELRQIATSQAGNTVNAYLIWDEVTREAALFDTGWEAGPIMTVVAENGLELKHLFITHHHEDHVAALGSLRGRFPRLKLHSSAPDAPPDQRNRANDFIHLGSLRITNRETPGHSPDGVTYVAGNFPDDQPNAAMVGDALFAGSMGRGFQSAELLRQKVRDQILSLPGATVLCPGHGPVTTVEEEKAHNPFIL